MRFKVRDREQGDWPYQVSMETPTDTQGWLATKRIIRVWVIENFAQGAYLHHGGSWFFRNAQDRTLFLLRWA